MGKKVLLFIATVVALVALPVATFAAGLTDVSGVISYNGVHVGKGILVTVTCNGNVLHDKTNKSGTYLVQFTKQQCKKNSTVTVSATVNGHTGSNTGKAKKETNKLNLAIVPVNVVPEFGTTAGLLAVIGAGGVFMITRRRELGQN